MIYYRVKPEYDNKPRFKERPDHRLRQDGILVANELYTERERAKIMNGDWMFERVEIPKSKIYFFFGARFA
jgi:hypothetical protein